MTRVLAGRRPVLEALRSQTKVRRVFTEPQRNYVDVREAADQRGREAVEEDRTAALGDAFGKGVDGSEAAAR